ncbi:DUF4190 domain-containing protein [Rathayibacter oskolensis]|uniref:DUF4190 domain-containing protein n=1 Tax=Rathayibacter TaxID=33886 RepID=UPI00131840F5|nr:MULTISPECIES: DUF4190 domain-containing protein [Rathayibacter]QHC66522.1 DUF4190 domain-containing protein [Rathayibacter sp. VKM Ac-2759]WKK71197.1 DUF4190 domain-containing protein [Rathayibacter oskolensis]
MPDDSAPVPAPGWYPHPADIGSELYWDGTSWTDRSRPAAAPAPSVPLYGTPSAPDQPAQQPELYAYPSAPSSSAGRNPMAIASLVLGIISILINPLLVPSILAIVFGVRGRAAAESLGGGRGLATAGLITGIVGIVTGVLSFLSNLSDLAGLAG